MERCDEQLDLNGPGTVMARLPHVGGDNGSWGQILNDYLSQSLTEDGLLQPGSVGSAQIRDAAVAGPTIADHAVAESKLSTDVVAKLNSTTLDDDSVSESKLDAALRDKVNAGVADESVTTLKLADHAVTTQKLSGLGESNGIASLDDDGRVPDSQLPSRLTEDQLGAVIAASRALGSLMMPPTGVHPTASVTHTADASGVFPSPVTVLWSDARINHFAGAPEEAGPSYGCRLRSTGANNPQSLYFGFHFTGTKFALHLTVWDTTDVTIYVDGMATTVDPYLVTGAGYQFVVVDGLAAGAHEVQCVVGWASHFLQVVCSTGSILTRSATPHFRFGLTGDSYTDSGVAPYFGGLARELHRLTGWAPAQLGQGSTGYTNGAASEGAGTGKSIYGSPSRLAALDLLDPDVVIVVGSVNDGGASPAAVRQAASDYYAALAPRPVIVIGVQPLSSSGDPAFAAWDSINAAVLAAAQAAANVIGIIDWRGEDWLTGTGSVSAPAGNGNQDLFIGDSSGSDTIHANYWGQRYLADRIVRAMRDMTLAR